MPRKPTPKSEPVSRKVFVAWMTTIIRMSYRQLELEVAASAHMPAYRKLCRAEMAHRRLRIREECK